MKPIMGLSFLVCLAVFAQDKEPAAVGGGHIPARGPAPGAAAEPVRLRPRHKGGSQQPGLGTTSRWTRKVIRMFRTSTPGTIDGSDTILPPAIRLTASITRGLTGASPAAWDRNMYSCWSWTRSMPDSPNGSAEDWSVLRSAASTGMSPRSITTSPGAGSGPAIRSRSTRTRSMLAGISLIARG